MKLYCKCNLQIYILISILDDEFNFLNSVILGYIVLPQIPVLYKNCY